MRLIDADLFIEQNGLGNLKAAQYSTIMLYEIKSMIDCAPTAQIEITIPNDVKFNFRKEK